MYENPNYVFFQKIYSKIPLSIKKSFKEKTLLPPLEFIKWTLIDLARPRLFHPYGMYFFTGLPGTGKTIFMSKQLMDYRLKFKDSIYIATNYGFKFQDFAINDFRDLLKIYDKPIIIGYDEIQNDFDARQWSSLAQGISERITQSRKMNGMMILGTAQKFSFVDRRLRQLTNLVYECKTLNRRLTISRIYEPAMKEKIEAGQFMEINSTASRGFQFFIQSDFIRNLYDSFQILESVRRRLDDDASRPARILSDLKSFINSPNAS